MRKSTQKWFWISTFTAAVIAGVWGYVHRASDSAPIDPPLAISPPVPTTVNLPVARTARPTAVVAAPAPASTYVPTPQESPAPEEALADWEHPEKDADPALVRKRDEEERSLHETQFGATLND